jgi:preprotein translocase subunit YajC
VLLNLFLQQSSPNSLVGFVPILLIFAIFYFLLFLPMQRQKKQQKKMLEELQNGNVVLTSGGIVGTIVSIDDDTLVLREAGQHQTAGRAQRGLEPDSGGRQK